MPAYVVSQVTAGQVIHNQVKVLTILKGVVHVNDEGILELGQDLSFIDDGLDTAFRDDARLAHLLHRKVLLRFLAFDSPHFAKAALADAKVVHKVRF